MDSNLGRSNGGKRFCTSSCSVPPQRIYPRFSRASSAVRPTFIQKGARGPTLVPNRLQRVQAPAYPLIDREKTPIWALNMLPINYTNKYAI